MPEEKKIEGIDTEAFDEGGQQDYASSILKDDPEYQELLKKSGKKPTEEGNDEDPGNGDNTLDGQGGDDGGKGNEDADNSEVGEGAVSPEYYDDILPGLTGKQFGGLDDSIKEIISSTHDTMASEKKRADTAEERLKKLLEDPVIKRRDEAIAAGKSENIAELPTLTDQNMTEIINLVDQDTPESRKKAREVVEGVVRKAVEEAESNLLITENTKLNKKTTTSNVSKKLLDISKLHPDLKIMIDDPAKPGEKIELTDFNKISTIKFENLGKMGEYLKELEEKQQNKVINDMVKYLDGKSPEAIYAELAVKFNLPIVKNADKEINKRIKDSNKKLFDRFLKNKDGGNRMADGKDFSHKTGGNGHIVDGIDVIALAKMSEEAYEKFLYKKNNNLDWINKIGQLRDKGERMLQNNPDLSSSSE